MKVNQSVNWVALPSGLAEDGSLRLSVFVAPQLGMQPDDAAAEPAAGYPYEAWPVLTAYALFENWAAEAAGVAFAVEVDGRPVVAAQRVSEPPSAELWSRLFGPETRVEPFVMDRPDIATTNTYDVATIVESLQEGYGHAAVYEPPDFDLPLEIPVEPDIDDPLTDGDPDAGHQPIVMDFFPDLVEVTTNEGFDFLVGNDQDVLVQGVNDLLAAARGRTGQAGAEAAEPPPAVATDEPLAVVAPLPTFAAANELLPPDGSRAGEWGRLLAFRRVGELLASDRGYDLDYGGEVVLPAEDVDAPEAFRRSFDLHKMLAALGDHPAMLRPLGLVVDLLVPPDVLDDTGSGRIRVEPQWMAGSRVFDLDDGVHQDVSPWTEFVHDPANGVPFTARPRSGLPGFLPLADGGYRLEQFDVDGAAAQLLIGVARATADVALRADPNLVGLAGQAGPIGDPAAPVPALRTAGITLVEGARAANLMSAGARGAANAGPGETVLWAEDITRGYRADVRDGLAGRWRSLHARIARYLLDGEAVGNAHDEGLVHAALTGPPGVPGAPPPAGQLVNIHERVLTWEGWSLSAPRPGASVSADPLDLDPRPDGNPVQRVANEPLTSAGLQIETEVAPGTLPRLRFGHPYLLRVRTVDLAGNSLTLAQADVRTAAAFGDFWPDPMGIAMSSAELRYLRFEPVPPPVVVREGELSRGDTTHRLVVRTGLDDDHPYGAGSDQAECLLFAPKGPLRLAELHGRFDGAIGYTPATRGPDGLRHEGQDRRAAAYDLATTEIGTFEHHQPGSRQLPYLPDPQSAGVALWNLPGMAPEETLTLTWDEPQWARPRPITLRLIAAEPDTQAAPEVDPTERTITLHVPPAHRSMISVASMVRDLDLMGLLDWSRSRLSPEEFQAVETLARRHRHYLFSPAMPIELVHAVQRPLTAPVSAQDDYAEPPRAPGATNWLFGGGFRPHAPSTASLDLRARWTDQVDDPGPPHIGAPVRTGCGVIQPEPVAYDVALGTVPVPWRSGRDASETVPLVRFYDLTPGAPQSVPPLEFADTRHHVVRFQSRATTRFAEFFPEEWGGLDGKLTVTGPEREVWVKNTARPPAPVVVDVAPLVARTTPTPLTKVREGNWIRIWLERPWYVSGHNEQLAVVVAQQAPSSPADPTYSWASLAGADLARVSNRREYLSSPPFILDADESRWVVIPEQPVDSRNAILQGTIPRYDPGRDQWYCDIRVDLAELYFPFVRLAVTRMQSFSIDGPSERNEPDWYRVSPIVVLEPVPVLPDRFLNRTRFSLSEDESRLDVELSGPSYRGIGLPGGYESGPEYGPRVLGRVQRRGPGAASTDELLAWETVDELPFAVTRNPETFIMTAAVSLHDVDGPPEGSWRLLVVEYDHLHPAHPLGEPGPVPRIVYSEVLELDGPVRAGS